MFLFVFVFELCGITKSRFCDCMIRQTSSEYGGGHINGGGIYAGSKCDVTDTDFLPCNAIFDMDSSSHHYPE